MTVDPVEIAQRLRRQRRAATRVLKIALIGVVVTFPLLLLGGAVGIPKSVLDWIAVPAIACFGVTWLALAYTWVNRVRDMRNKFRPGSAQAYEDE